MELGGASPNEEVYGKLSDVYQRENPQICTGIYVTPEATWLIGRLDGIPDDYSFAKDAPNLEKQLYSDEEKAEKEQILSNGWNYGFVNITKDVSYISQLDKAGTFQVIAVVPEITCLKSTADGRRVYLFTGLSHPDKNISQGAIFQSDDQGKTWRLREEGFSPIHENIAWEIQPYFSIEKSVWSWLNENEDTILQFSPDGGDTAENVIELKPLLDSQRTNYGLVTRHIVQISDNKAIIWASQRMKDLSTTDGKEHILTHRIPLTRNQGKWLVGKKTTIKKRFIEQVIDNRNGNVIARLYSDVDGAEQIALLNQKTLEWQLKGKLPSTFGLLPASNRLESIHVGKNSIVVSIRSSHKVPRWLYPWSKASIDANAVFSSTDWGESWGKLDIDGPQGVLGMDRDQDKIIWTTNSYEDETVRSYDLVE